MPPGSSSIVDPLLDSHPWNGFSFNYCIGTTHFLHGTEVPWGVLLFCSASETVVFCRASPSPWDIGNTTRSVAPFFCALPLHPRTFSFPQNAPRFDVARQLTRFYCIVLSPYLHFVPFNCHQNIPHLDWRSAEPFLRSLHLYTIRVLPLIVRPSTCQSARL